MVSVSAGDHCRTGRHALSSQQAGDIVIVVRKGATCLLCLLDKYTCTPSYLQCMHLLYERHRGRWTAGCRRCGCGCRRW